MYQTYGVNGRLPEPAVTEKATRRKFSAEYKLRCQGLAGGGLETPSFQPAASQFIATLDCADACATLCRRGQRMAWSRHPLLFDFGAGANVSFRLLCLQGCPRAGGHVVTFIFTLISRTFLSHSS